MPNEPKKVEEAGVVDLDEYQKGKEEFGQTVDDILAMDPDKSDEEIIAELDAKKTGEDTGEAGTATKDPDPKPAEGVIDEAVATDLLKDGQDVTDGVANTDDIDPEPSVTIEKVDPDDAGVDWKSRSALLETELANEKQKTSSWNGRIRTANDRVKELEAEIVTLKKFNEGVAKAATAADPVVDPTADSDKAILDRLHDDFPELGDAINVLQKQITNIKGTATDKVIPTEPAREPVANTEDNRAHMDAIHKVHPDLGEMVRTGVLQTWINTQPDYIRPTLQDIYDTGKSGKVVKMCTEFKSKTGWKSQLASAESEDDNKKSDKLNSMLEVTSTSGGAPAAEPDKNDYDGAAKEAGL